MTSRTEDMIRRHAVDLVDARVRAAMASARSGPRPHATGRGGWGGHPHGAGRTRDPPRSCSSGVTGSTNSRSRSLSGTSQDRVAVLGLPAPGQPLTGKIYADDGLGMFSPAVAGAKNLIYV